MEIRKKERNWASAAVLKGMTWQTNAGMTFADGVKKWLVFRSFVANEISLLLLLRQWWMIKKWFLWSLLKEMENISLLVGLFDLWWCRRRRLCDRQKSCDLWGLSGLSIPLFWSFLTWDGIKKSGLHECTMMELEDPLSLKRQRAD